MQTSAVTEPLRFYVNNINQPLEEEWSTFQVPLGILPYTRPALKMSRIH